MDFINDNEIIIFYIVHGPSFLPLSLVCFLMHPGIIIPFELFYSIPSASSDAKDPLPLIFWRAFLRFDMKAD